MNPIRDIRLECPVSLPLSCWHCAVPALRQVNSGVTVARGHLEAIVEIIEEPRVVRRAAADYLGIRTVTPFRGMLRVRDDLMSELNDWLTAHQIDAGPFFLRLHVIDMEGPMDLEVGAVTKGSIAGGARVRPGVLPAGGYATLTYRDHARRANRALTEWASANGVEFDRSDDQNGD